MTQNWEELWGQVGDLLPIVLGRPLLALLPILFTLFIVVIPLGAVSQFVDRKLSADLQARVGPSLSGLNGFFQPIIDALKLLQKETGRPVRFGVMAWILFHTGAAFSTMAVLPISKQSLLIDTELSALLPFWSAIVLAIGMVMSGLEGSDVAGRLGGVRVAAQSLTSAVPSLVALMAAAVNAGGFGWSRLAEQQDFLPHHWAVFSSPFLFLAFLVFVGAGMVMNSIPPMDGGLFQTDVHFGLGKNISGARFVLYEITRFYGFFLWSVISVVCFLGAWRLPSWVYEMSSASAGQAGGSMKIFFLESIWTLGKTSALMLLVRIFSRTLAKLRIDQITSFCWRVLTPLSFVALAGATIWTMGRSLR